MYTVFNVSKFFIKLRTIKGIFLRFSFYLPKSDYWQNQQSSWGFHFKNPFNTACFISSEHISQNLLFYLNKLDESVVKRQMMSRLVKRRRRTRIYIVIACSSESIDCNFPSRLDTLLGAGDAPNYWLWWNIDYLVSRQIDHDGRTAAAARGWRLTR